MDWTGTSGNDSHTGTATDDVLNGVEGNDTIRGGGGNDTIRGGGGNDSIYGWKGDDRLEGGAGDDKLFGGLAVRDSLIGGDGDDSLTGGGGPGSILDGGEGNDTLTGSGGGTTLRGGNGDDLYFVGTDGDVIDELANGGIDEVRTFDSYTLPANVENLWLLNQVAPANGTGNLLNNKILGSGSANVIDGGAGADHMRGFDGNDTYYVDNIGDFVDELYATSGYADGLDTVMSSISYTLGEALENLTLLGSAAINGTGNGLANVIRGNSAANILQGLGGNDTYQVDNTGDVVDESVAGSGGTDTVVSSLTFTLGANLENLTLSGSAAINGTGNGARQYDSGQ